MVVGLLAFILVLVFLVMVTLGAVLLARFVLGAGNAAGRIITAAIGGPLAILLPVFAIALIDDGRRAGAGLGVSFVVVSALLSFVAWPVAHLATRKLDGLLRFDPQVFE